MSQTEEPTLLRLVEPPAPIVSALVVVIWAVVVLACFWLFALFFLIGAPFAALLIVCTPDGRAACRRAYVNGLRDKNAKS